MINYRWACTACEKSNEAGSANCVHCGCPAETSSHVIDLYKFLLDKYLDGNLLSCPKCNSQSLKPAYDQDCNDYFYLGIKRRQWLFRILKIEVKCTGCGFVEEHEYIVPLARSMFRKIFGRDLTNKYLKRI